MMISRLFLLLLLSCPLQLVSDQRVSNVLAYGGGAVQVNAEINIYENLVAGKPIQGSVMITHPASDAVDINSFIIGDKPVKVSLVQSVPMSSTSPLLVSIYQFQLEGMKIGDYQLPVKVKVGGKVYQAPPLNIQISQ